eukprot:TRINITY_DN4174_c0_g2_i1.p1 TRINITY_DN4174_c0_g2~~TRINITY_DN4174_c0_g2_i1.p1  ORF type:complete len:850 (-),score=147.40 TRINITY_DN4174_c0_g2_i1:137-2686(-)
MAGKGSDGSSEAMPNLLQAAAMGIMLAQGWHMWSETVAQGSSASLLLCGAGLLLGLVTAQQIGARAGAEMISIRLSLFWLSCMMSGGLSAIAQLRLHSETSNNDSLLVNAFLVSTFLGCCIPYMVGQVLGSSSGEVLMPSVLAVLVTEAACNNTTFPNLKLCVAVTLVFASIFGMACHGCFGGGLSGGAAASASRGHAAEVVESTAPLDPFFPATALASRQYSPHFMVSQRARCLEGRGERLVALLPRSSENHARSGKNKAADGGKQRREKQKESNNPTPSGILPDELAESKKEDLGAFLSESKLPEGPVLEDDLVKTEDKMEVSGKVSESPDPLSVAEVGEDIRWNVVYEEMQRIGGGSAASKSMADRRNVVSEDASEFDTHVVKQPDHHAAAQERLKAALAAAAAQAAADSSGALRHEDEDQAHYRDLVYEGSAPLSDCEEAGEQVYDEPFPLPEVASSTGEGHTQLKATAAVFVPQAAVLKASEHCPEDGMSMPFEDQSPFDVYDEFERPVGNYGGFDAYQSYGYGMEAWSGTAGWGGYSDGPFMGEDGPFAGDSLDYTSYAVNAFSGRGSRKGKGFKDSAGSTRFGKGFSQDMPQEEEAADSEPVASLFDTDLPDPGLGRTSLARKGADRPGKGKNRGKSRFPEPLRIAGLDESDSKEYITSLCASWGALTSVELLRRADDLAGHGDEDGYRSDVEALIEFTSAAETQMFLDACRQNGGLMTEDGRCLVVSRFRSPDNNNRPNFTAMRTGPSENDSQAAADLVWAYIDPNDKIQSGFSSNKMRGWFEDGYFKGHLLVAVERSGIVPPRSEFRKLKDCYQDASMSFLRFPKYLLDQPMDIEPTSLS